jgi:hypothetical protein
VSIDVSDDSATEVRRGLEALGEGIAWAGFWIGLGIAAATVAPLLAKLAAGGA